MLDVLSYLMGGKIESELVTQTITDWLDENVAQETGYVIDKSLTVEDAAADAKKTGQELSDLKSAITILEEGKQTLSPEMGDYNGSAIVTSTNRALYICEMEGIKTISVKSGLQFSPAVNNAGVGSAITYLRTWDDDPYDVSSRTEKYLFVFVRKSDNSPLSSSDVSNAITFTYKDSFKKLNNVVFGSYTAITPGTSGSGYYSGTVGSTITTNADGGTYYPAIDLSAYAGKDVRISFTTTGYTSTRISAICDASGVIGKLAYEREVYRDGYAIFHIDSTYKYLYISANSAVSNLSVNVVDNAGLVNEVPKTVYVATTGNDSNDGSYNEPFATFQRAITSGAEIIKATAGEYAGFYVIDRPTPLKIMLREMPTTYDSDHAEVPKIKITSGVPYDAAVYFENCAEVVLEDMYVCVSDNTEYMFKNVTNLTVTRCFASGNSSASQKMGFRMVSTNGTLNDCVAWNISKDAFNISVYGNVSCNNCVAYNCGDDGLSHHDGCRGFVNGGEFYNCTKAGIATPCHGSFVSVQNAYCHDNAYGLYSVSDGVLPNSYGRISNCVFKGNTKDLYLAYSDLVGWNNIYDTKTVEASATFTEIANS